MHGDNTEQLALPDTTTTTSYSPVENEGPTTVQEQPRVSEKPALRDPAITGDKNISSSGSRNGDIALSNPAHKHKHEPSLAYVQNDDGVQAGHHSQESKHSGTAQLQKPSAKDDAKKKKKVGSLKATKVDQPTEEVEEAVDQPPLLAGDQSSNEESDVASGGEDVVVNTNNYKSIKRTRVVVLESSDDESPSQIKRVRRIQNEDIHAYPSSFHSEHRARETSPDRLALQQPDDSEPENDDGDFSTEEESVPAPVVKSVPGKGKESSSSSLSRKSESIRAKPRRRKRKSIIPRGLKKKSGDAYSSKPATKSTSSHRPAVNKKRPERSRRQPPDVTSRNNSQLTVDRHHLPDRHDRLSPEIPLQNSLNDSHTSDTGTLSNNEEETNARSSQERQRLVYSREQSRQRKHEQKTSEETTTNSADQVSGDEILASVNRSSPMVLYDCVATLGSPKSRRKSLNNSPEKRLMLITRKNRLSFRGADDKNKLGGSGHVQPFAISPNFSVNSPRKEDLGLRKTLSGLRKQLSMTVDRADVHLTAADGEAVVMPVAKSIVAHSDNVESEHTKSSKNKLNERPDQEERDSLSDELQSVQDHSLSPTTVKEKTTSVDNGQIEIDGSELERKAIAESSEEDAELSDSLQTLHTSTTRDNNVEKKEVDRRKEGREKHHVKSKGKPKEKLRVDMEERDDIRIQKDAVPDSDEESFTRNGRRTAAKVSQQNSKAKRRVIDAMYEDDVQNLEAQADVLMTVNSHNLEAEEEVEQKKKKRSKAKRITKSKQSKRTVIQDEEEKEDLEENTVRSLEGDAAITNQIVGGATKSMVSKNELLEINEERESDNITEDMAVGSGGTSRSRKKKVKAKHTCTSKVMATGHEEERYGGGDAIDVATLRGNQPKAKRSARTKASKATVTELENLGRGDGSDDDFVDHVQASTNGKKTKSKLRTTSRMSFTSGTGEERQEPKADIGKKKKSSKRSTTEVVEREGDHLHGSKNGCRNSGLPLNAVPVEETSGTLAVRNGRKKTKRHDRTSKPKRKDVDEMEDSEDASEAVVAANSSDVGGGSPGEQIEEDSGRRTTKARHSSRTTKAKSSGKQQSSKKTLPSPHITLQSKTRENDFTSAGDDNKSSGEIIKTADKLSTRNLTSRQSHDREPGVARTRQDPAPTDTTLRETGRGAKRSKNSTLSAASIRSEQDSQYPPPKKRKTLLNKKQHSSEFQLSVVDDEVEYRVIPSSTLMHGWWAWSGRS